MVELPSKPHSGSCSRVGNTSNSLICVLPRKFGVGVYPSSQIYSSLNLVIEFSHELMMRKMGAELLAPQAYPATIGQRLAKQLKCQKRALQNAREEGKSASATACAMRRRCGKAARLVDWAGAESSGSGAKRRLIPQQLRAPIPAPTKRRAFRGNIPKESQALPQPWQWPT